MVLGESAHAELMYTFTLGICQLDTITYTLAAHADNTMVMIIISGEREDV